MNKKKLIENYYLDHGELNPVVFLLQDHLET